MSNHSFSRSDKFCAADQLPFQSYIINMKNKDNNENYPAGKYPDVLLKQFSPEITKLNYDIRKKRTPRTQSMLMKKHRENERLRHQTLNISMSNLCHRVPGYNSKFRHTKVKMMKRVVKYIMFLEYSILDIADMLHLTIVEKDKFLTSKIAEQYGCPNERVGFNEVLLSPMKHILDKLSTKNKVSNLISSSTSSVSFNVPSPCCYFEVKSHDGHAGNFCDNLVESIEDSYTQDSGIQVGGRSSQDTLKYGETSCTIVNDLSLDMDVDMSDLRAVSPRAVLGVDVSRSVACGVSEEEIDSQASQVVPDYEQFNCASNLVKYKDEANHSHSSYVWNFYNKPVTKRQRANVAKKHTLEDTILDQQLSPYRVTRKKREDKRKVSWMNGFMMFSKLNRRAFIDANPGVHTSHISKMMGHAWHNMAENNRKPYRERAREYSRKLVESQK